MTTPTKEQLTELLERVRKAEGPDRELDAQISAGLKDCGGLSIPWARNWAGDWATSQGGSVMLMNYQGDVAAHFTAADYTSSLDAAVSLVERMLPGWWYSMGTCCVSDDARVCPDWNSPEHGGRLRSELGAPIHGDPSDHGFDVDRRPAGNLPLALLEALLEALIWKASLSAPISQEPQT